MSARSWLGLLLVLMPALGRAQVTPSSVSPHGRMDARIACIACHTTEGWKPVRQPMQFDHARDARFILDGSHAAARCNSCHLDLRVDQPRVPLSACSSCHL
ncbi:MAG TPA: hypothetical protein VK928_05785, partial [Longimicrobiales bacterium]|nr:hypothetical protein [Longimicrobiales bacterium]